MFGGTQRLTAAQLTAFSAEFTNDPLALGYGPYTTGVNDYGSLQQILNFLRDGATVCPVNRFPQSNVAGNVTHAITNVAQATPSAPITVTSAGHGLASNQGVVISGVGGYTQANGTWILTVVDANTFTLNGTVNFTGNAYTSGGVWVVAARNPTVRQADVSGAILFSDLITNAGGSAVTADQYGKISLFGFLINQPAGTVALANPDGTDNNNVLNLRNAFNANSASRRGINALANRPAARAEALLGLSGQASQQSIGGALFSFSNIIDVADVVAIINGHY